MEVDDDENIVFYDSGSVDATDVFPEVQNSATEDEPENMLQNAADVNRVCGETELVPSTSKRRRRRRLTIRQIRHKVKELKKKKKANPSCLSRRITSVYQKAQHLADSDNIEKFVLQLKRNPLGGTVHFGWFGALAEKFANSAAGKRSLDAWTYFMIMHLSNMENETAANSSGRRSDPATPSVVPVDPLPQATYAETSADEAASLQIAQSVSQQSETGRSIEEQLPLNTVGESVRSASKDTHTQDNQQQFTTVRPVPAPERVITHNTDPNSSQMLPFRSLLDPPAPRPSLSVVELATADAQRENRNRDPLNSITLPGARICSSTTAPPRQLVSSTVVTRPVLRLNQMPVRPRISAVFSVKSFLKKND